MNHSTGKVHKITLTAILMAIVILMAYTPLGYLKAGPVEITFITIPVVIGAIVLGPVSGAFLGAVFGLTSFAQCFSTSLFGAALLGINPIATFLCCMVPRVLIGIVAGLLFPALRKVDRVGAVSFIVTSVAGALTNTVFFAGMVVGIFQNSYFGGTGFFAIFLSFFTLNVALEVVVCALVAAALSRAMLHFIPQAAVQKAAQ